MTMLKLPKATLVSKASKARRAFFRSKSQEFRELLVAYDPLTALKYDKKIARKYPNISDKYHSNSIIITNVKSLSRKQYTLAWKYSHKKAHKTYIATDDYINGNEILKILNQELTHDYSLPTSWHTRIDAGGLVFGGRVNWSIARSKVLWLELVCVSQDKFYLAEYHTSPVTGILSVQMEEHSAGTVVEALKVKGKRKPLDHDSQGVLPKSLADYIARFTHRRAGVRHRVHSHWG